MASFIKAQKESVGLVQMVVTLCAPWTPHCSLRPQLGAAGTIDVEQDRCSASCRTAYQK
jgi:hypothetical protein